MIAIGAILLLFAALYACAVLSIGRLIEGDPEIHCDRDSGARRRK